MVFSLGSSKMVMNLDDAIASRQLGVNDEDAVNQVRWT